MIQWVLQRMREGLKSFQRNSRGGCSCMGRVLVEDTAHWQSARVLEIQSSLTNVRDSSSAAAGRLEKLYSSHSRLILPIKSFLFSPSLF